MRMGGSGSFPFWFRELGCSLCVVAALWLLDYHHWTLILTMGATYGLLTTYFKKKGTDATWVNWSLVGMAFGLSVLPIVLVYHNYMGFTVRTAVCMASIVIWQQWLSFIVAKWFRKVWDKAVVDEFGRGFILVITLLLL